MAETSLVELEFCYLLRRAPGTMIHEFNLHRVPARVARSKLVDIPLITSPYDANQLEFELVRTIDGLEALRPEWEAFYQTLDQANPFLSYPWTKACLDTQSPSPEPFVLALRRSGKLVGVAALCIEKRLGFRVLRFIAEDRSDYLGFLGTPAIKQHMIAGLAAHSDCWDLIVLRRLAEPFTSLHKPAVASGGYWHRTEWTTSAFCRCDGDFEALHAAGPSWIREMPRHRRRFLRDGGTAEHFTGREAAERLDVVAQVEAASWKGRQEQMRLQPGAGQDLLRKAFSELGDQIQLWLAFMNGQPVAYQIDFLCGDRLWLYQCGYDEIHRNARAGSVLAYIATEHAWLRGVREYDYLTGDEPYKRDRTTELRRIYTLAGHRTARGRLAYTMLIAPRWKLRKVPALRSLRDWIDRQRTSAGK